MKLLILGGANFLGRHLIQAALARGHQVTVFNRGQTNPELFPEVEKLRGDRDADLEALKGRTWDAVIDTCGFTSARVRATATLLADSVKHYTFISSISVYRDECFATMGLDETAPLEQLSEGTTEDANDGGTYGARKALCEQAAEAAMPGRVLNVRAGLIVGPYEGNGRFLYWVSRMALGGDVLAPARPDALVQLIDVRDLAGWIIGMAESGGIGIYNATGPAFRLTFRQMLEACNVAAQGDSRLTWVDEKFLLENGVKPFSDLPFWLLAETHGGFLGINCRRAFKAGLACRSLIDTARDTLEWQRGAGSQSQCGLGLEREQKLLRIWNERMQQ